MTSRPKMLNKKKRGIILSVILGILAVLILAILGFDIWFNKNYFVIEVDGSSMENTLMTGEYLYASYHAEPKRGDIVIIDVEFHEKFKANLIIKRLIAVEGDTIKCENGVLFLKESGETEFKELDEPYITYAFYSNINFEVEVGEGEIFFLGDNRPISQDSEEEDIRCLEISQIVGVVPQWALDRKASITKWERFRTSVANFFRGK